MIAVAPTNYGSKFPELNDSVIYVWGSDKPTYSVVVNDVVDGEVKVTITGTETPMILLLSERNTLWGTRKDINAGIANRAANSPSIC